MFRNVLKLIKNYNADVVTGPQIYKNNKKVRIKNHTGSNGNEQIFDDKYHRETFFVSVHTRNLSNN